MSSPWELYSMEEDYVFDPKSILMEFRAMNNVSSNDALLCRGIHGTMYLGFLPWGLGHGYERTLDPKIPKGIF